MCIFFDTRAQTFFHMECVFVSSSSSHNVHITKLFLSSQKMYLTVKKQKKKTFKKNCNIFEAEFFLRNNNQQQQQIKLKRLLGLRVLKEYTHQSSGEKQQQTNKHKTNIFEWIKYISFELCINNYNNLTY